MTEKWEDIVKKTEIFRGLMQAIIRQKPSGGNYETYKSTALAKYTEGAKPSSRQPFPYMVCWDILRSECN